MTSIVFMSSSAARDIYNINRRNIYCMQQVEIEAGEIVTFVILNAIEKIVLLTSPISWKIYTNLQICGQFVNNTQKSIFLKPGDTVDKILGEKLIMLLQL